MYYQRALNNGIGRLFNLPRLSWPVIFTLGLTMAAVLTVVSIVFTLFYKPVNGVSNLDRLLSVDINLAVSDTMQVTFLDNRSVAFLADRFKDKGEFFVLNNNDKIVEIESKKLPVSWIKGSRESQASLGIKLLDGASVSETVDADKIFVSQALWDSQGLDNNADQANVVQLDGKKYVIVGVIEQLGLSYGSFNLKTNQIWQFIDIKKYLTTPDPDKNAPNFYRAFFLQNEGKSWLNESEVTDAVNAFINTEDEEQQNFVSGFKRNVKIQSLREKILGDTKIIALTALAITLCLMLMACLNLSNLFISYYQSIAKELAIQLSVGANWSRIIISHFIENLPTFVIAGVLGLLSSAWINTLLLNHVIENQLLLQQLKIDEAVMIVSTVFVFGLSALFALLVRVALSRSKFINELKGSGKGGPKQGGSWLNSILMTFQLSIASILVVFAISWAISNYKIINQNMGYEANNVYTIEAESENHAWFKQLVSNGNYYESQYFDLQQQVATKLSQAIPHTRFLYTPSSPSSKYFNIHMIMEEHDGKQHATNYFSIAASKNYFEMFNIPFVAGKAVSEEDAKQNVNKVVVDRKFADLIGRGAPYESLIGKPARYFSSTDGGPIIAGIVENVRHFPGKESDTPTIYTHIAKNNAAFTLHVQLPNGQSLDKEEVVKLIREIEPNFDKISVKSVQELMNESTSMQRTILYFVSGLSLLIITLAMLGIGGLSQMKASANKFELAIRMATGASKQKLVKFLLAKTGLIIALAVTTGVVIISIIFNHVIEFLPFEAEFSWPILIGVNGVFALLMLISVVLPSWSAISKQPMRSLREL